MVTVENDLTVFNLRMFKMHTDKLVQSNENFTVHCWKATVLSESQQRFYQTAWMNRLICVTGHKSR